MKYVKWLVLLLALTSCSLPPPKPNPNPPTPDPTPVVNKVPSLWIETIDSVGKRKPGSVMVDLPYWKSLQDRGHHVRHYDVTADSDLVNAKLQVFLDVKPPCFIVYNAANNEVLGAAPLVDKAGINSVVSKFSDK